MTEPMVVTVRIASGRKGEQQKSLSPLSESTRPPASNRARLDRQQPTARARSRPGTPPRAVKEEAPSQHGRRRAHHVAASPHLVWSAASLTAAPVHQVSKPQSWSWERGHQ